MTAKTGAAAVKAIAIGGQAAATVVVTNAVTPPTVPPFTVSFNVSIAASCAEISPRTTRSALVSNENGAVVATPMAAPRGAALHLL
ncbi:MAG: hypothetical protein V7L17_29110 [Nostoc sp.]